MQTRSMFRKERRSVFERLDMDNIARVLLYLDTKCVARFMMCSHAAIDAGRLSFYKEQIFNQRADISNLSVVAMVSNRLFCSSEQQCLRMRETTFVDCTRRHTSKRVEYRLVDVNGGPLWKFEWRTDPVDNDGAIGINDVVQPSAKGLWILFNANHKTGGDAWFRFSDAV